MYSLCIIHIPDTCHGCFVLCTDQNQLLGDILNHNYTEKPLLEFLLEIAFHS